MNLHSAQHILEKETGATIGHQSIRPRKMLNVTSKISHAAFESFGNFCKRLKSDLLFSPFDVANVISSQIGFFRQLLLTQTCFPPPSADGFPQKAINFARSRLHNLHETRMTKPGYQLVVGIFPAFKACNSGAKYSKGIMPEDKAAALIGSMRQCKGLLCPHGHFTVKKELLT
jgi:hypothetical protein